MIWQIIVNEIQIRLIGNKYIKWGIQFGDYLFIISVVLLGDSHFNFINLSRILTFNIPILNWEVEFLLWFYVIGISLIATPFVYLERRTRVSVDLCPLCKVPYEKFPRYKCPECNSIVERKL